MSWLKISRILDPYQIWGEQHTYASNPVADHVNDSIYRIYFSSRDEMNRSSIYYVEIDIFSPGNILKISNAPVVRYGNDGEFDDNGASIACILNDGARKLLYYTGWNLSVGVPWRNSIGLAISTDGGESFFKYSKAPIMDRHETDPFSLSYPYVIKDGNIYKMWYGSNLAWGKKHQDMRHVIKYAESSDGIHWSRDGHIAINLREDRREWGVSKPAVIKENNIYKMWFSCRSDELGYRIGYAEAEDGVNWARKDEMPGIDVSPSGWDSEMIEYPNVFLYGGKKYMLYNGNQFGKTGIGLSVWQD